MKNKIYLALAIFLSTWGPGCVELAQAGNGSGNVSSVIGLGTNGSGTPPITFPQTELSGTTGWFSIIAEGTPGANNYEPFYKDGVAYQVSGGVKAVCVMAGYTSSAVTDGFQLMSATASFARDATSVTGGVYENGASGRFYHYPQSANFIYTPPGFIYKFGASTFPGVQVSGGSVHVLAIMNCKEM